MSIITKNPATGEKFNEYEEHSEYEVNRIIEKADKVFHAWKKTSFSERAELMKKAAKVLNDHKHDLAQLMAKEMGKPLSQGVSEAEKCAWVCEYYAENAEDHLKDQHFKTENSKSYVSFRPLGTVLAIMPWNFPFWQVFRFAAPSLIAGNTALLKHSSNTTGCGLEIENIFREAGFPEYVFNTVKLGREKIREMAPKIIGHPLVKAVTLTGSVGAGKKTAQNAGANLKKTVMELGGSDPYVVLEDADIEKTVETCVTARMINSGQSCIAAKRFIINEKIYDEFVDKFTEKIGELDMGDPTGDGIDYGPQARGDLREDLHRQVTESIGKGAELLLGGEIPEGEGFFYPATVLKNVQKGMPAFDEETFGPVAAMVKAKDDEEALRLANDSDFGLGAAVFSKDEEKAEKIAREHLEAGCCFVNDFVKSDPRLPFGGIKESGYGRELSPFGIKEFVNIKTVVVK